MNSIKWSRLTALVNDCCLPPLAKPYDEYIDDYFSELDPHIKSIPVKVAALIEGIRNLDERLYYNPFDREAAASLIVLLREMDVKTPWAERLNYTEHRKNLTIVFMELLKHFNIDCLTTFFTEIFDACMEILHRKLTKDMWKRQVGALHCYREMLKTWPTKYKMNCPLQFIFPGIFLQIDDYNVENKIKGMQCCRAVLINADISRDESGYIIVIYETIFKYIAFKEASIVSESLKCMMILLQVLVPKKNEIQWTQVDDVFEVIINNIPLAEEVRSKFYWEHMIGIMITYDNVSMRFKNKILAIITNDLELAISNGLQNSALLFQLVGLQMWLKSAWQIWRYSTDKHLIILLFKFLYLQPGLPLRPAKYSLTVMLNLCTESQRRELFSENCVDISEFPKKFKTMWIKIKNICNV